MDITQCVPCGGACARARTHARAHTHTHTKREREHCMSILLEHSQQYIVDDMFLWWTVVGNETWYFNFEPRGTEAGMQWQHTTSSRLKTCESIQYKVMLTVLSDIKGLYFWTSHHILTQVMQHLPSNTSKPVYQDQEQVSAKLTDSINLPHDYAHPMWPTDFRNQDWLNAMQWEVLDNLHTAQTSGHVIFGLSTTTGHTFMLEDYMWRLWYKASGGSSRNSLQMGYTDLCTNGNPVLYLWQFFRIAAIP